MRMFTTAALLLGSIAVVNAQTSSSGDEKQGKTKETAPKLVTVVGCVTADENQPGQYTIVDSNGDALYRLTGTNMHGYVGQQVEVTGGPPRRFTVRGGLLPTPNAAAQAGAIDPPPAAATPPVAGANAPTPEFRVKSVKSVPGKCLP
jgi:hypothetical protein